MLRGAVAVRATVAPPSQRSAVPEALGSTSSPLAVYVTRDLPVVRVPAVPFGQVQRPQTVLSLRWGSGPARAGLEPGLESATVGASSFDVDAAGRIYLIDSLQDR